MEQRAIHVDGQPFDAGIEHFSFPLYHRIERMDELRKLALFPNLTSASFCGTNLDDVGLEHVSQAATLENLDLQDTNISNDGLAHLAGLSRLKSVRLKENSQLTNECIPHLLRLESLTDLGIHETSIGQDGLKHLADMKTLKDICVDVGWNGNYTRDGLLALSMRMPDCTILAKGCGTFFQGQFDGEWVMTEQEWLEANDPEPMIEYLHGKASERKLRLFACATFRHLAPWLKDEGLATVEKGERFADGQLRREEARRARNALQLGAQQSVSFVLSDSIALGMRSLMSHEFWIHRGNWKLHTALVRDIFGNPFRPASVDSSCLTSMVRLLAQSIYDDRAFDRMPVLADALEEAGCINVDILRHCRGLGPHVRGCWVVDLLLGKE